MHKAQARRGSVLGTPVLQIPATAKAVSPTDGEAEEPASVLLNMTYVVPTGRKGLPLISYGDSALIDLTMTEEQLDQYLVIIKKRIKRLLVKIRE